MRRVCRQEVNVLDEDESQDQLADFAAWVKQHFTGEEKGEAQLYLERLFQAFGHGGLLIVKRISR